MMLCLPSQFKTFYQQAANIVSERFKVWRLISSIQKAEFSSDSSLLSEVPTAKEWYIEGLLDR